MADGGALARATRACPRGGHGRPHPLAEQEEERKRLGLTLLVRVPSSWCREVIRGVMLLQCVTSWLSFCHPAFRKSAFILSGLAPGLGCQWLNRVQGQPL
ncbi:uncharacterized protein [Anas platyrhynchos]|uniref:uncharacterized protein isoform X2 n=1 Tax=Anas platyrhynchos TaxID=8839 RepID=UPI003AF1EEDF